jgi:GeoRSP system PqqD family protein
MAGLLKETTEMSNVFRNPDVMWREEDDSSAQAYEGLEKGENVEDVGTSLLFSDGEMVSLNLLGTEIWKLCDGRSVDEVISELHEQFDVETDILRADVMVFLNELAQKGFVRYE